MSEALVKPNYQVVGKSVPRVDAVDQVTGAARCGADVNLPGQLWAKFLHRPHGHARIQRIDTSRADQIPGVVGIITRASLGASATQDTRAYPGGW